MTHGTELRRRLGRSTVAAISAACAIAAFPAVAISSEVGEGTLSPRLTELAKPAVASAPPAVQARELSLARSGPGSLLRGGDRVLVEVRFEGVVPDVDALRASGAQIVAISNRYRMATVAMTPAALPALGRVAGVAAVTESLAPIVHSVGSSPVASAGGTCTGGFGAATSEGDLQLNAMKARTEFGVDGGGIAVGILSDSYDRDGEAATSAAEDVTSGDLPGPGNPCGRATPVNVLKDYFPGLNDPPASDEGRAMAQIVHDLAPGAALAFATAFEGELAFAQSIEKLAKPTSAGGAGARVIVDDISYFFEPFFQEGPVGVAVSKVTGEGVTYFSSAGNNNLISGGKDFASWEAPGFRDAPACPAALGADFSSERCMDFKPGGTVDPTFGLTVLKGATLTIDLQWAEPRFGATADLDAFLLDASGKPIEFEGSVVGSTDNNIGAARMPVEVFQWENNTGSDQGVQLAIVRCFGTCNASADSLAMPRLKVALLQNGGGVTAPEYPTGEGGDVVGPTIFGHNGAENAMSTGAIRFNVTSAPETFSSRGPVTHYFGPAGGAAPALPIPKQTFDKPDLVATDGGANTFFGSCTASTWRFFGTSAAAPHAAAVAALELEADPFATVAEVKEAQVDNALEVGAFSTPAVGAGLLDAVGALEQITGSSPGGGNAAGPGFSPPTCPAVKKTTPAPVAPVPPVPAASPGPPETSFSQRPHRIVRTRGKSAFVAFRFHSDQADSFFLCSIDGGPFRSCNRKLARRFLLGRHSVRVAARNSAGEVDPTPAVFYFKVKRAR